MVTDKKVIREQHRRQSADPGGVCSLPVYIRKSWFQPRISRKMSGKRAVSSGKMCCVPQCHNRCTKEISLHHFPKLVTMRNKWAYILRIGKAITPYSLVCSAHFTPEDFFFPMYPVSYKKRLKANAVPSQNIPKRSLDRPSPSPVKRSREARALRALSRATKCIRFEETDVDRGQKSDEEAQRISDEDARSLPDQEERNLPDEEEGRPEDLSIAAEALLLLGEPQPRAPHNDIGVQVDIYRSLESLSFIHLIKNDGCIQTLAGVPSLSGFERIASATEMIEFRINGGLNMALSCRERALLVLMKLKLNISFRSLSVLFGISKSTCVNYFHYTVDFLHEALESMIIWPEKELIKKNMPRCFLKFNETRVVMDCSEVSIERSACLTCRIKTYSHYKGTHTLKFLLGITPGGLISFTSATYGGKASDKFITTDSGILDLLEPGDAVMCDKGFHIDDECLQRGLIVYRPPFLRGKKQFSLEEGLKTAEIAQARVHVERAIQRIKTFNIFKGTVSFHLLSKMDKILVIVSALVNLSRPIIGPGSFV